jgi:hypothetical protein
VIGRYIDIHRCIQEVGGASLNSRQVLLYTFIQIRTMLRAGSYKVYFYTNPNTFEFKIKFKTHPQ